MSDNAMIDAVAIPLEFWQDPQGDVILIYSEQECSVYFACWVTAGEPAPFIGQLSFGHASGLRSFHREFCPYQVSNPGKSEILRVPDSELVREHLAYRQRHYSHLSTSLVAPNHYVVRGHDIYHEILAVGFTSSRIPNQDVTDPRLVRLITNA